ncbi:hypothetical protein, partial [Rummeliibacillus suwonensis]|uniref:hypothetical protein n=1 Tax=Rummeliibacillus suwonensis TaxID=1306154 RepID=UPI001AAE1CAB
FLNRYAAGSHLFAFPAGVEQASAPIVINDAKIQSFAKLRQTNIPNFYKINTRDLLLSKIWYLLEST